MARQLSRLIRAVNLRRMVVYLTALWKVMWHPQAPGAAKLVAVAVLGYVISPVDILPDVIPVLGQLDDLLLIPIGVTLASQLTPPTVWQACLQEAERLGWSGLWRLLGLVLLWLVFLITLTWWLVSGS